MRTRALLLAAAATALASCGASAPHNTGVYLLVDTSGSYNRQLNKAEQIVLYALSRLQPLDSIAVARIDAGSFSEKNIIAKASFDDRPSSTNRQKRAFASRMESFVDESRPAPFTDITEMAKQVAPNFDQAYSTLLDDLKERGLYESTVVVAMGEFGRTPWLNASRGRDHYPSAWSLMLTGCGLKRGVVVGGTDRDGVDPDGRAFNEQNLFATLFTALGIDPYGEYDLPGFPTFHRVEDRAAPIAEVLA